MTVPAGPAPAEGRRSRLWPSIVMLVVGVVAGIAGIVLFVVMGLAGILGATAHRAPTTVAITCQVGDYDVYQYIGIQSSGTGGTVSGGGQVTMTASDVEVTGPSGGRVAVADADGSETITLGSSSYQNAVRFHAGTPGVYLVRVAAVQPSSIVVAPSLGSQFLRAAPWLVLAGAGGLLVVGGVAWLIVAIVRRRRVATTDPWGGPAPPLAPGAVPPGPWLPRNYDPFPAPGPPPGAPPNPGPPPPAQAPPPTPPPPAPPVPTAPPAPPSPT